MLQHDIKEKKQDPKSNRYDPTVVMNGKIAYANLHDLLPYPKSRDAIASKKRGDRLRKI